MIILYQLPCDLLLFGTLNLLSAEPEINQCSYTFLHKLGIIFDISILYPISVMLQYSAPNQDSTFKENVDVDSNLH